MNQNGAKMAQQSKKDDWKLIKCYINKRVYDNKIKPYAEGQGVSISDVIRLAINQFLKTNP